MSQSNESHILSLKEWVPQKVGFAVMILIGFTLQVTNVVYISNMQEISGTHQWMREDVSMIYQAGMIGLVLMFPNVFIIKFRFMAKHILLVSVGAVMLLSVVPVFTTNVFVLVLVSFVSGAARMMGYYEAISTIRLMISPDRNFGLFYTVAYFVVLIAGQFGGYLSVHLGYIYGWEAMHALMLGAHVFLIILLVILLRPIHFMKPEPIKDLDWQGWALWSILLLCITYGVIYGETLDWFNSSEINFASMVVLATGIMLLWHNKVTTKPYITFTVLKIPSVLACLVIIFATEFFVNTSGSLISPFQTSVMGLDRLHLADLNLWMILGVAVASLLCFWWFKKIQNIKILLFTGFGSLMCFHLLMEPVFSASASESMLYLPYFFRGMGYLIIYVAVATYLIKGVDLDNFPHGWVMIAAIRSAAGPSVISSIIYRWQHVKVVTYMQQLSIQMDQHAANVTQYYQKVAHGIYNGGASFVDAQKMASTALYKRVYLQSLTLAARDIYANITILGFVILTGILVHHFSKPTLFKKFGDRFWKA